jgi:hypothetical protein
MILGFIFRKKGKGGQIYDTAKVAKAGFEVRYFCILHFSLAKGMTRYLFFKTMQQMND